MTDIISSMSVSIIIINLIVVLVVILVLVDIKFWFYQHLGHCAIIPVAVIIRCYSMFRRSLPQKAREAPQETLRGPNVSLCRLEEPASYGGFHKLGAPFW